MKWILIALLGALVWEIHGLKITVNHTINQCKGQGKTHFPAFNLNPKRIV